MRPWPCWRPGSAPSSKLATLSFLADTTLDRDQGPVNTDDPYRAMDWLVNRQGIIEKAVAGK